MFRPPRLSRADARILHDAGDIAEAQMRLAAQVRAGTGAFARPFRRFGSPLFLINLTLMAAASALLLGAWA